MVGAFETSAPVSLRPPRVSQVLVKLVDHLSGRDRFCWSFRRWNFEQSAGPHIVNVPVNGYVLWNQRMLPNSLDIIAHTLFLIADRKPLDEFSCARPGALPEILESLIRKGCRFQAAGQ